MINYILFVLISIFWGGSFIAINELIGTVPPITSAFYRVLFSILFIILIYGKEIRFSCSKFKIELARSSMAGLFSIGFPFCLLFWGEQFIGPSIAGIMNGTVPFWTLIISMFFFEGKQNITIVKILGLLFGLIGMLFIFYPKINIAGNLNELKGLIALTGMAFFYAFGINYNRRVLCKNKKIIKGLNTFSQQLSSLIFIGIILLFTEGFPNLKLLTQQKVILSILYLSFFSTTLAFIIFYRLIRVFGSLKTSSVTFFIPVVAMILDYLINARILNTYEITGAIIILLSMFLINSNFSTQNLNNLFLIFKKVKRI
ncbi:MAG: DMT family transporter [Halobacteriovoraceae bacterium]|nr:DMT family transporter [Halobacteriovoraceae bacterium]